MGLGIRGSDWGLGLEIGIGDWHWSLGIGDWDSGLGWGLVIEIGDWDWN